MDCSPSGSCVHGIFQARILEWVAISSSRGSSWPKDRTHVCVSYIGRQILLPMSHLGNPTILLCLVNQLCLTLCNPMDCSPPGSSIHGVLQARILEWVAMPSSRRSSQPEIKTKSPTLQADFNAILLHHTLFLCFLTHRCYG